MEAKVYSTDGKESGTIELDDSVFAVRANRGVIYDAIRCELANARVGGARTLTRAEVHGSNAKPYRQKGTGRARQGDKKSPLIVGGGVIFGPRARGWSYAIPRKEKRTAYRAILSEAAAKGRLFVVNEIGVPSGKTRDLATILKAFGEKTRTVIVLAEDDNMVRRAARNIPHVSCLTYNRLRAHDLFYARRILMTSGAAQKLAEFYGEAGK